MIICPLGLSSSLDQVTPDPSELRPRALNHPVLVPTPPPTYPAFSFSPTLAEDTPPPLPPKVLPWARAGGRGVQGAGVLGALRLESGTPGPLKSGRWDESTLGSEAASLNLGVQFKIFSLMDTGQ